MTSLRHVHSLDSLPREHVAALLDRAEALRGQRTSDALRGRSVVLLFLNPSLRTRVSMELAARQLGADVVTLDGGFWKLEFADGAVMRGDAVEHVREAVRVLARYGDLLGVRAFPQRQSWAEDAQDPIFSAFLRHSTVPVLNLESALYHPCQALADLLTIRSVAQRDGAAAGGSPGKIVLTWADHPKPLPTAVPNSFALAVTQMGWNLTIARPDGYDLPPEIMRRCAAHAAAAGSALEITDDRGAALAGARYVYAKSWGRIDRYGQDAREISERSERGLSSWIVDAAAMRRTNDAWFMHCLPVRRNVVVSDDVIDGPRSAVFDQAENRLHVQKAILLDMLAVSGDGAHRKGD